ncbi:hypothetical protein SNOG_02647 [Parastagonospora nodorum SN15]|uniref:Uncharacterized protein n=1 Tax=Phaeosphaeria nodorum (strain SN15 / ATCC MYA-4574 / FGSC 10173) TaxID=321614 RepID=Q0V017_PHANO|nr:hypothetical protein SNOG_02647 [Parastagonospora nodorum SN15]EAT89378.2 hypothetical protein SNOG_02647 [Parastagonospora nodorum SN15]
MPMLAPQPNGLTTEFPLTANLLDPLVSPHCSLSPPPPLLHPIASHTSHLSAGHPSAPLTPTHLPVRP